MRMKRRWFTWHMNAYRLIVGAIVLAIILPASAAHLQAMWVVALACVLVVACAVVAGTRVPMIRNWLAPLTTLSAVAPVLILIVLLATDVWVYRDSGRSLARGQPVTVTVGPYRMESPTVWFVACLLLWILAFPLYLVARSQS